MNLLLELVLACKSTSYWTYIAEVMQNQIVIVVSVQELSGSEMRTITRIVVVIVVSANKVSAG